MKKCSTFFILLIVSTLTVSAQYSEFVNNKLAYNPAYAGSEQGASVAAITRNQFGGLEGSQRTQILTFATPFGNAKNGIGLNAVRDAIGIAERFAFAFAYARHFPMGKGTLSIGSQTSLRFYNVTLSGGGETRDFSADLGLGAYYTRGNFFVGISMPELQLATDGFAEFRDRQLYTMTGVTLPMGSKLKLQPQLLFNWRKNAPFGANLNLNLLWLEKFTVGATLHAGNVHHNDLGGSPMSILFSARLFEQLLVTISHHYTFSELENYNGNVTEIAVRYNFRKLDVE